MQAAIGLETYRIVEQPRRTIGIGVTARSFKDVFDLIDAAGFQPLFEGAGDIHIREGVRIADSDPGHEVPNMGPMPMPMPLRGVWFPAANIGWGALDGAEFGRLDDAVD